MKMKFCTQNISFWLLTVTINLILFATTNSALADSDQKSSRLGSNKEGAVLSGKFDACSPAGKPLGEGELTILFQDIPPMSGSSRLLKVISKLTISSDTVISEVSLNNRARIYNGAGQIRATKIKTLSTLPLDRYNNGSKLTINYSYLGLRGPVSHLEEQHNLIVNSLKWPAPYNRESMVCNDSNFNIEPIDSLFDVEAEITAAEKPESIFYDATSLNDSMPFKKGQLWDGFELYDHSYYGMTIGILSTNNNELEGAVYYHGFKEARNYLHNSAIMLFKGIYNKQKQSLDIKGLNYVYAPASNWIAVPFKGTIELSSNTMIGSINTTGTFEVKLANPNSPRIQQAKEAFNKHFNTQDNNQDYLYVKKDIEKLATANGIFSDFKQKVYCPESFNHKVLQKNGFKGFNGTGQKVEACNTLLVSGYNVWVKPYWYVWGNITKEPLEVEPDRQVQASVNGKYTDLIAKYRCPSIDGENPRQNGREYNSTNNSVEECGQTFKKAYYVWDKPFWYGWANLDQQRVNFLEGISYRNQQLPQLSKEIKEYRKLLKKYPQEESVDVCIRNVDKVKATKATAADYELCVTQFNQHIEQAKALEKVVFPLEILEAFNEPLGIADDYSPNDVKSIAINAGARFMDSTKKNGVRYDSYDTSEIHKDLPSAIAVFVDPGLFSSYKLAMFIYSNEAEFAPTLWTGSGSTHMNIGSIFAELLFYNTYETNLIKKNGPNTPNCPGEYGALMPKTKVEHCWTRDKGKTQLLIMKSSKDRWHEYRNLKYFDILKEEIQN